MGKTPVAVSGIRTVKNLDGMRVIDKIESFGFPNPKHYPVLAKSLTNIRKVHNGNVSWMHNDEMVTNYCQIFRWGVSLSKPACDEWSTEQKLYDLRRAMSKKKYEIWSDLNLALAFGVKQKAPAPTYGAVPTLGGVSDMLGRNYRPGDHLSLCVLRPLTMIYNTAGDHVGNPNSISGEILCDISLQVTPGNAYPENSTLDYYKDKKCQCRCGCCDK